MIKLFNFHFTILLVFVVINNRMNAELVKKLEIAVIGAGVSGLASAKNALAHGYNVTIYEQAEDLGGTWRYTDKTGNDQYGVKIHSAMYQGLRTNSPQQTMDFPDHPYPNDSNSYPTHTEVLKYLHSYADRYDLKQHMKLNHMIIRIHPIENEKWEIIVKDLPNNKFETVIYDVVFVCNGHFAIPRYPKIPGINGYNGKFLHSHDFRTAEQFRDENVLIIGSGPSAIDLVGHISKTANRVTFSKHKRIEIAQSEFRSNVAQQNEVTHFTSHGAEFSDGSNQTFSVIICATGYNYAYSFLTIDTGINVKDNCVSPLYKEIFNIEHPTMVFIGVPYFIISNRVQDLQARYAMKFISGEKKLPSKDEMLLDFQSQVSNYCNKNHFLAANRREYYTELAEDADIEDIPDIILDIYHDSAHTFLNSITQFRNYKYIINNNNNTFTKIPL